MVYEQMGVLEREASASRDITRGADASRSDAFRSEVETVVGEVASLVSPRLVFTIMRGELSLEDMTLSLGGATFKIGRIIARQLRGAETYAVFVCTAGEAMQRLLDSLEAEGDMVRAFIADALGSVVAERTADYMEGVLQRQIDKLGWRRTNRFSPGYCGWHVSAQHDLFALLVGHTAGVSLTASGLMLPIKSVSGIIGLGPGVRYLDYTCGLCDLSDCYKRRVAPHPPEGGFNS